MLRLVIPPLFVTLRCFSLPIPLSPPAPSLSVPPCPPPPPRFFFRYLPVPSSFPPLPLSPFFFSFFLLVSPSFFAPPFSSLFLPSLLCSPWLGLGVFPPSNIKKKKVKRRFSAGSGRALMAPLSFPTEAKHAIDDNIAKF